MPIKFTNKHNLPQEFVDAITLDNHVVNGDISVTTLIDSPQIRQLRKKHEYEVDLTDQMAMFFGTAIHERLESSNMQMHDAKILNQAATVLTRYADKEEKAIGASKYLRKFVSSVIEKFFPANFLIEQTLTLEVEGWTVSGTLDRYIKSEKRIRDYKTITASQLAFPEQKVSWKLQQNIYAAMLRKIGYEVEHIEIVAIVKDWSKMKLKTSKDYPQAPVIVIPIEIADNDKVLEYVKKRVLIHQRAEQGEDIPCTAIDRWAKADSYAVIPKGNKRAARVFDKLTLAEKFVEENNFKYPPEKQLQIELRPAESFRCKHYCPVASVCPQHQKELEMIAKESQETF